MRSVLWTNTGDDGSDFVLIEGGRRLIDPLVLKVVGSIPAVKSSRTRATSVQAWIHLELDVLLLERNPTSRKSLSQTFYKPQVKGLINP